jgi:hypothetical protein
MIKSPSVFGDGIWALRLSSIEHWASRSTVSNITNNRSMLAKKDAVARLLHANILGTRLHGFIMTYTAVVNESLTAQSEIKAFSQSLLIYIRLAAQFHHDITISTCIFSSPTKIKRCFLSVHHSAGNPSPTRSGHHSCYMLIDFRADGIVCHIGDHLIWCEVLRSICAILLFKYGPFMK